MSEQYPFSDLPHLDEDVIRPLQELLGDNFSELVDDYLESFPIKLQELKHAAMNNDIEALMQISHTLKSSSGSFGFIRLFKSLERLELQARSNDVKEPTQQVDFIEQEFNCILDHMGSS